MLDFDEFKQHVADHIKDHLPEEFADAKVSVNEVRKNNGMLLHGLTIQTKDSNISPTIYLESFYETYKDQGMEMEVVLEKLAQIEMEHATPDIGIVDVAKNFSDPDFIRSHVIMSLVNAEKNADMLKTVPHKMTEDLAIVYKVYLGSAGEQIGTILITDKHMKQWDITPGELHECAVKNSNELMPAQVKGMGELIREMMGEWAEDIMPEIGPNEMMYVITNERKTNGAATLVYSDALERLSEKVGADLYILPSSIHETIAVPCKPDMDVDVLTKMVREVNQMQVAPEERLSDNVYKYDAKTKTLSLADECAREQKVSMVSEKTGTYGAVSPVREENVNAEAARPRHRR